MPAPPPRFSPWDAPPLYSSEQQARVKRPKLVTDVSQWGLMRWPARSRARLVICSLIFSALAFACALFSADYILHTSASVLLNLLIITANLFLLVVTAFLQAALLGELF